MTTATAATEAVYQAIVDGYTSSAYTFDGERFTPTVGTAWIRVAVRGRPSGEPTFGPLGQRYIQRRGTVLIQAFAPTTTDDGVKAALDLAATARAVFEGKDVDVTGGGVLTFSGGDVRPVGVDRGGWYQANAEIQFTYDDTI